MRFLTKFLLFVSIIFVGCTAEREPQTEVAWDNHEVSPNVIIKEHSNIYGKLLKESYKAVSEAGFVNEGDIDSISNVMVNQFLSKCDSRNNYIVEQDWRSISKGTRVGESGTSIDIIPDSIKEDLFNEIISPDYTRLPKAIEEIKLTNWYLSLDSEIKNEVDIDLALIENVREEILLTATSQIATRTSPGDRMIWSETMLQLTPEQQRKVLNATLTGIGLVTGGAVSLAIAVIGLFI